MARAKQNELVLESNEAVGLVEVDGETGVGQDSIRNECTGHVGNKMNSACLLWETFKARNVNVGFVGGVHDGTIGAGDWNGSGRRSDVLDRTVPATEMTGGSRIGIAW